MDRSRADRVLAALGLCLGAPGVGACDRSARSQGVAGLDAAVDISGHDRRLAAPGLHGRGLFWYQRPLRRLREVVPGRVYISAMPSYWGLELAQDRHHFRTIVNLYPEYTDERSPDLPDEIRFATERGINYIGNEPDDREGEAFVARTLALAEDPASWPLLVHCHASMDRSPAWMGLYRFVVEGWPLADAFREIEHHRGLRPKASVILLYNRLLPSLAPTLHRRSHRGTPRRRADGTPDPDAPKIVARGSGERRLRAALGKCRSVLGQRELPKPGKLAAEPAPVAGEQFAGGLARQRAREQITLAVLAAQVSQVRELVLGLDPFGDDFELQSLASAMIVRAISVFSPLGPIRQMNDRSILSTLHGNWWR